MIERDGRKYIVDVNPATLKQLDRVKVLNEDEVRRAVETAQKSFDKWSSLSFERRAEYILKAREVLLDRMDEVATLITREMGKPKIEAIIADVMAVGNLMGLYSKRGAKLLNEYGIPLHIFRIIKKSKISPRPYGVISVIAPWNYPFAIPMSGIVFALLAGNTVVFKPASDVPLVGMKIQEIFDEAGLPHGVLNTVITRGGVAEKVLCAPPVRKVIFTGSTDVGVSLLKRCAENIIPVVAELGGKDPMVVLEDADLELASSGAVWGAFTNCGQVCASVERLYVHKKVADELISRIVEKTKALRVGNGEDPDTDIGPLVNEGQLKTVMEHVNDAVSNGAKALAGGYAREDLGGYFYEPTVLVNVNHSMRAIREETFGPTLPIMTFSDDEEAVRLANDTIFGLTASVWTADKERGERLAKKIWAGTVVVNDHAYTYGAVETPWQGVNQSGLGRSHSDDGFREFLYPQHINIDNLPSFAKRRPWWFPYSEAGYTAFAKAQQAIFRQSTSAKFSNLFTLIKKLMTEPDTRQALKLR
jgi:succinate-semialdehyde dehydrogenase/glutarate-semialdehyde dehydrogenase